MRYNDYYYNNNNNVMILLLLYFHIVFSEKSCGKRRVSTRWFPKKDIYTYIYYNIIKYIRIATRRSVRFTRAPHNWLQAERSKANSATDAVCRGHYKNCTHTHIYRLNINIVIIITGIMGPKVACLGRRYMFCFRMYIPIFFFTQFLPSAQW